ncbi:MAG: KH domain-containing protein [Deltaproteobacteria bacterium]|nr:KH domain-containing protein [Deltaproteobacteria bacterium]MBW2414594.1 KH domain-containing protein [Deltaproteobacteria bacterium]
MKDLVRFVASELVSRPDEIELRDEGEALLLVVADDDLGSMVGRRGKTARALRTLLDACDGPQLEISSPGDLENDGEPEAGADDSSEPG